MKILLLTPPLIQPNTPYAATPMLTAWLRLWGHKAMQEDLSLELLLRFFSREGISALCSALEGVEELAPFVAAQEDYLETIDEVMAFLQDQRPELAETIAERGWLPEGPALANAYADEEQFGWNFRGVDVAGKARHLASLYLDDLAEAAKGVDASFGFSRYAESLAGSLSEFAPLKVVLSEPDTLFTRWLRELSAAALMRHLPDMVVLTVPFPGCLVGALRIAEAVKKLRPRCHVTLGGGYVNTELRALSDPGIFEYVDSLTLDSGMLPLQRLVEFVAGQCGEERLVRTFLPVERGRRAACDTGEGRRDACDTVQGRQDAGDTEHVPQASSLPCASAVVFFDSGEQSVAHAALPAPVYDGLSMERYFGLFEVLNPVTRLWSDGRWNKLVLAHGCCWHRCAFCDTSIDYIGRYDPADAETVCDWMEAVMAQTQFNGFHFVDEALPPDLLERVCDEILRRGLQVEWWGNIRFENRLKRALIEKMAAAGCIAVTGGLETACDRTLKLMQKGITTKHAERVLNDLADVGIMTHAYLMYGFPTQTLPETLEALAWVRDLFEKGALHSAFWHRFALTAHSPIAQQAERFGIILGAAPKGGFAVNEIPFEGAFDYDLARLGEALHAAVYNYNLGCGLDLPVEAWLEQG